MSNHLPRSSYYYWKKFLLEIIISPQFSKEKKEKIRYCTSSLITRPVACPKTKRLDRAIFRRKRRVIFANTFVDGYELGAGVSRKRIEFHLPPPPSGQRIFSLSKKKTVISPFIRRNGDTSSLGREGSTRD